MGEGGVIVAVAIILCTFITIWIYMGYCSSNEVGMFSNPKYEKRIRQLEYEVKELKENK